MTKFLPLIGAAAIAVAMCGPARAADPTADTVVATVNGTEITLGQMIEVHQTLPEKYMTLPEDVLFKGILDQLIQQTALAQETEKALTKRQELDLQQQRLSYLANATLEAKVSAAVTDEAVQKLFDEKYANAAPATEYHAAHILVKTEDEAKAVEDKLAAGGDFAEIAKASSTDQGSASNGGDLGWFGTGMMVEPFEKAVVALKPGETSAPVQTQFGFHVIRLIETRPAPAPTLDEKKQELTAELQQKTVEQTVNALMDSAKVERMTDGISPDVLKNTDLLGN